MASLLFCGPKLAACGIVLSIWGVIMLVRNLLQYCETIRSVFFAYLAYSLEMCFH